MAHKSNPHQAKEAVPLSAAKTLKRKPGARDQRPDLRRLKGIWKGMNITEQNIRQSRL